MKRQLPAGPEGRRPSTPASPARRDGSVCLQGMRVVNIVGFRRGYNFLNELLALARPFGTVVKHLVLDLRAEVEGFHSGLGCRSLLW